MKPRLAAIAENVLLLVAGVGMLLGLAAYIVYSVAECLIYAVGDE